jgi:hypothetical protein
MPYHTMPPLYVCWQTHIAESVKACNTHLLPSIPFYTKPPSFLFSFFLTFPYFFPFLLSSFLSFLTFLSLFLSFCPTLFVSRRRRTSWKGEEGNARRPRESRKRPRAVKGGNAAVPLPIKSMRSVRRTDAKRPPHCCFHVLSCLFMALNNRTKAL